MENWGLIKYRETNVLLKKGETSSSSKEDVAKLVAHEIGHQVRLVLQYLSSCSASCTFSWARKTQQSENMRRAILQHLKSYATFSYGIKLFLGWLIAVSYLVQTFF